MKSWNPGNLKICNPGILKLCNYCNYRISACYTGFILAPAEGFVAFGHCLVAYGHRGGPLGPHGIIYLE